MTDQIETTATTSDPAVRDRIGIIQSRGLGDIVIALPIAWHYHTLENSDIYWPICEEFVASFRESAPWVNWIGIPTDPQGEFFLKTPLSALANVGIGEDKILYLYQYLSSDPQRTDPDLFAMCKFDQYKYAIANVPFIKKWELKKCITRNPEREKQLFDSVVKQDRYMVYQGRASDVAYEIDLSTIDPAVQRIEITELTDNIFDWLLVLEGAETLILIDSVFANLIDQLGLCKGVPKYFMRKWNRRVDGNPVLLGDWGYVPVQVPEGTEVRSLADGPAPTAQSKPTAPQPQAKPPSGVGSSQTYTPFGQSKGTMPTSFLHATKQGQQQGVKDAVKPNAAKQLLSGLGLKQ